MRKLILAPMFIVMLMITGNVQGDDAQVPKPHGFHDYWESRGVWKDGGAGEKKYPYHPATKEEIELANYVADFMKLDRLADYKYAWVLPLPDTYNTVIKPEDFFNNSYKAGLLRLRSDEKLYELGAWGEGADPTPEFPFYSAYMYPPDLPSFSVEHRSNKYIAWWLAIKETMKRIEEDKKSSWWRRWWNR